VALIPYGIVTVVAAFSWRYAWTQHVGWLAGSAAPLADRAQSIGIIILAEVWKTTPFVALLLLGGLALVPEDLLKAAALAGANAWQRLTRNTLPVNKPVNSVALIFRIMHAARHIDNLYSLT